MSASSFAKASNLKNASSPAYSKYRYLSQVKQVEASASGVWLETRATLPPHPKSKQRRPSVGRTRSGLEIASSFLSYGFLDEYFQDLGSDNKWRMLVRGRIKTKEQSQKKHATTSNSSRDSREHLIFAPDSRPRRAFSFHFSIVSYPRIRELTGRSLLTLA